MTDPRQFHPSRPDSEALRALIAALGAHTTDAVLVSEADAAIPGESRIVWCNAGFEAMTGYGLAEIIGRTPSFLRGPGTDMATVARIIARRHANLPVREELLNYRKNGEPFWVDISMAPCPPGDQGTRLIVAVQRDITEAKQREAALRKALEADSLLAAVVENVGAEIQILDAATLAYVQVNGAALRNLGYSAAELIALGPAAVIEDWEAEHLRAALAPLTGGCVARLRLRWRQRRRDGGVYPCKADLTSLRRGGRGLIVAVVRDQTDRDEARRRLALSEQRYRLAVEASADGVFDMDLDNGSIVYSARNREMLGYDPAEWPDHTDSWRRCVHPEDRDRVVALMERHLAEDTGFDETYRMRHRDGSWRWWRSRAAVWRDPDGRARRLLGTNSDVTDLVRARHEAEEAARRKADFLAKMSHEIRTPLNGVLGMTEIMRAAETDPVRAERLRTIESSGRSLLSIIEDVLTLARLEVGADGARREIFEPAVLCASALDPVRAVAGARGLALGVEAAPGPWVGDARRIRQVLINLAGNAVKFTPRGGVVLRARPLGAGLRFEVEDSGPGVPEALRESVFEPFRQGDESLTRAHGGLGLGLAIAREFVRAMGGEIGVGAGASGGALFWFDAPAAPAGAGPG